MRIALSGLAAALMLVATPAMAQDAEPASDFTVSGGATLVTDYRFRGVDTSGGDIAIQGTINVSHASGFYIGTWASSIEEDLGLGHTELDLYGGWAGDLGGGLGLDVGVLYYVYPNADDGVISDYVEPYAKLSYTYGPGKLTLGVAYAPEQEALFDEDNLYLSADLAVGIPDTGITLTGHLGYVDGVQAFDDDDTAVDFSVGATYALTDNLTVGVAYVDVDGDVENFTDDTVVASIGVAF